MESLWTYFKSVGWGVRAISRLALRVRRFFRVRGAHFDGGCLLLGVSCAVRVQYQCFSGKVIFSMNENPAPF